MHDTAYDYLSYYIRSDHAMMVSFRVGALIIVFAIVYGITINSFQNTRFIDETMCVPNSFTQQRNSLLPPNVTRQENTTSRIAIVQSYSYDYYLKYKSGIESKKCYATRHKYDYILEPMNSASNIHFAFLAGVMKAMTSSKYDVILT